MGIFIGLTRDVYSSVVIYAKEFDLKKSIPRINGLFRMFGALASTLLNDSNEKKRRYKLIQITNTEII